MFALPNSSLSIFGLLDTLNDSFDFKFIVDFDKFKDFTLFKYFTL